MVCMLYGCSSNLEYITIHWLVLSTHKVPTLNPTIEHYYPVCLVFYPLSIYNVKSYAFTSQLLME